MNSNYRIVKEVLWNKKVRFAIEISVDDGIDGWRWIKVQMLPFGTLEEAKRQIKTWRENEIVKSQVVWTEILDTKTNKIVNL
jgi:hypothetical protein